MVVEAAAKEVLPAAKEVLPAEVDAFATEQGVKDGVKLNRPDNEGYSIVTDIVKGICSCIGATEEDMVRSRHVPDHIKASEDFDNIAEEPRPSWGVAR